MIGQPRQTLLLSLKKILKDFFHLRVRPVLRGGGAVPWENINYKASPPSTPTPSPPSPSHFQDFTAKAGQAGALGECWGSDQERETQGKLFQPAAGIETRPGHRHANTLRAFPGRVKLHHAVLRRVN